MSENFSKFFSFLKVILAVMQLLHNDRETEDKHED